MLFHPFPLQLAPLFVIIGTGCVGAVAFTIRQATKNPEAWCVWEKSLYPFYMKSEQRNGSMKCHW